MSLYLMYADEADQDLSKEFLVYAAVFFPSESIGKLHTAISNLRAEHGFRAEHPLKFSPGNIPNVVSREKHAELKTKVLELAAEEGCKCCCYVAPSSIAKAKPLETRLKWAVNTLCLKFDEFLAEQRVDAGIVKLDHTTDYSQEAYVKEIFQEGLDFNGKRRLLSRVAAIDTTQNGLSHMSSITDIVVGSFRFAINEPDKDKVGALLTKLLAKLMWSKCSTDGSVYFRERGLVIRPKDITLSEYQADIEAFLSRMNSYLLK